MIRKIGFILVLLMALLQGFYAIFAYVDPVSFANIRGTVLASAVDTDWIHIYASRTLFVALIIGALLYFQNYKLLLLAALFGTIMPLTDGYLAYQADAQFNVVAKHIATLVYLVITSMVLIKLLKEEKTNKAQY
jgi:hypothetical protein